MQPQRKLDQARPAQRPAADRPIPGACDGASQGLPDLADLPKPLFPATRGRLTGFSVTADGQRFLMNVRNEDKQYAPVTIVTNWTAGIK